MVEGTMWGKDIIGLFGEDVGKGRAKVRDRDVLGFFRLGELSRDGCYDRGPPYSFFPLFCCRLYHA